MEVAALSRKRKVDREISNPISPCCCWLNCVLLELSSDTCACLDRRNCRGHPLCVLGTVLPPASVRQPKCTPAIPAANIVCVYEVKLSPPRAWLCSLNIIILVIKTTRSSTNDTPRSKSTEERANSKTGEQEKSCWGNGCERRTFVLCGWENTWRTRWWSFGSYGTCPQMQGCVHDAVTEPATEPASVQPSEELERERNEA